MKAKQIGLALAFCVISAGMLFASDPNLGTWKLNEAKSKLAGPAKNTMVVYTADGDKVKVTVDGVDANGKPTHNEWTGKYDGKDYPVTGDAMSDMRSLKQTGKGKLALTVKNKGKVTLTGTIMVAADGKSRTVTTHGKDANGKKMTSVAVYHKQ